MLLVDIAEAYLRRLYILEKRSSFEIAKLLDCSEHKINYWIRLYNIPKRSISEAIYLKNNPTGDPFKIKAVETMEDAKLLGMGLGLYWGEGNKRNKNSIRLGNTDPLLITRFIEFLVNILGVSIEKLRFGLQVFNDMHQTGTLYFWLKSLRKFGIKKSQFFKLTVTPARSIGNYRKKSKYGVLTVMVCNIKLKKILDSMLPT